MENESFLDTTFADFPEMRKERTMEKQEKDLFWAKAAAAKAEDAFDFAVYDRDKARDRFAVSAQMLAVRDCIVDDVLRNFLKNEVVRDLSTWHRLDKKARKLKKDWEDAVQAKKKLERNEVAISRDIISDEND